MGKLETTVTLVTSKAGMAKLADAADLKSYRPHRLTHYLAVNNILIDMLSSRE